MLSSDEIEKIEEAESFLEAAVPGGDHRQIRAGIERLDKATRRFAELMMDSEVLGAVQGKTMEAAGESIGEGPTAPHPFAKAEIRETAETDAEAKKIEDLIKYQATAGESTED
jgi:molecular chaperone DnaK/molecular chaperone HscA